jgi:hypothetical protein
MSTAVKKPRHPSPEPDTPIPEQDPATATREATGPESRPIPEAESDDRP